MDAGTAFAPVVVFGSAELAAPPPSWGNVCRAATKNGTVALEVALMGSAATSGADTEAVVFRSDVLPNGCSTTSPW